MILLPKREDGKFYCYAAVKKIFEHTGNNGGVFYSYILSSNETITNAQGEAEYVVLQNGSNVPKKEFSDWNAKFIGTARNIIAEQGLNEGDFIGISAAKLKNVSYRRKDGSYSERKAEIVVFDFEYIKRAETYTDKTYEDVSEEAAENDNVDEETFDNGNEVDKFW